MWERRQAPAGIAAPREEWEDFVEAMEDKGDEDDFSERNQKPSRASSSSRPWVLPTSEMVAREVALRAEREEGTEAGKELPKLRCCNRTADQSGECVACIRLCLIGPCQVQQRRRSRAQIQHEGGSRVYPGFAGSACVPYAPLLRSRRPGNQ